MDLPDPLEPLRAAGPPRLALWPERDVAPASVALLAGSFDPITVAHVAMARAASALAGLVVLTYSVRTLPKESGAAAPLLSDIERVRTVAAVCAARESLALGLCSHGLLSDQVAAAGARFPGAELSVVMGSDKLAQLFDPAWYDERDAALAALFARAAVRYSVRAGDDVSEALTAAASLGFAEQVRPLEVDAAVANVSSRTVRELVRAGENVSGLVPPEALDAVLAAVRQERG